MHSPETIEVRFQKYLQKCKSYRAPYVFSFCRKRFVVYPSVFNPRFVTSSKLLFQNLAIEKGSTVLDMGCGCGVLGINALLKGASFVTFVDSNPYAIENTRANIRLYGFTHCSLVLRSNLFSKLGKKKFDTILFNSPFIFSDGKVSSDPLVRSVFDTKYRILAHFFKNVRKHLTSRGTVQLIFSDLGNREFLEKILETNQLQKRISFSKKIKKEHWWIYRITPSGRG